MTRLVAALLLAASLPAAAALAATPHEVTAEYALLHTGLKIGHVVETFTRKGDTYTIESVTRSEGVLKVFMDDQVTLESSGTVGPDGLKPLHFGQRRAKDGRKDIDATFDWKRGVLVSRFGGETKEIPLPAETQDRISFMYQFMNLVPGPGPMVVAMSNGRKVEHYRYRFVEEIRITTPAGQFDTLHYARITENAKDSKADVWLAKDRYNLPVRIVFDDPRGLRLEQTLLALQTR